MNRDSDHDRISFSSISRIVVLDARIHKTDKVETRSLASGIVKFGTKMRLGV